MTITIWRLTEERTSPLKSYHKPHAQCNQCSFAAVLPWKGSSCVGLHKSIGPINWVGLGLVLIRLELRPCSSRGHAWSSALHKRPPAWERPLLLSRFILNPKGNLTVWRRDNKISPSSTKVIVEGVNLLLIKMKKNALQRDSAILLMTKKTTNLHVSILFLYELHV